MPQYQEGMWGLEMENLSQCVVEQNKILIQLSIYLNATVKVYSIMVKQVRANIQK